LDSAYCSAGTIHITISADGVWNGKENVLLVYPYKDEIAVASSDKEVQELNIYLEELLDAFSQRLFHGTVCAGTHRNAEKAWKYFLGLVSNLRRQKYISRFRCTFRLLTTNDSDYAAQRAIYRIV